MWNPGAGSPPPDFLEALYGNDDSDDEIDIFDDDSDDEGGQVMEDAEEVLIVFYFKIIYMYIYINLINKNLLLLFLQDDLSSPIPPPYSPITRNVTPEPEPE